MAVRRMTAAASPAEADAATLVRLMTKGHTTSERIVASCLARIEAIDRAGPHLNSVIELNPEASAMARALDAERRAGRVRGPLHGLLALLKDNTATDDAMATSAGSLALAGVRATLPESGHMPTRRIACAISSRTHPMPSIDGASPW